MMERPRVLGASGSHAQESWRPTPPMPSLERRTVHVWRLRIALDPTTPRPGAAAGTSPAGGDDARADAGATPAAGATWRPDVGARLEAHLTGAERERAARFRQPIDRLRFMRGRGLVRELLGYYLGQPPSTVPLRLGPSGKPELDHREHDPARLRFNVSHAGAWALVALSRDREVGVDIEEQRPMRDLIDLAQRFFAPVESAALEALAASDREAAFFRIWSRKEAFVKATGHGIAHGLDRFSVTHAPGAPVTLEIADAPAQAARWSIAALDVGDCYAAAVAFEGSPTPVTTWEWIA